MKITRKHLRNILLEMQMSNALYNDDSHGSGYSSPKEKKHYGGPHAVNISDLQRAKETVREWVGLLLDELKEEVPQVNYIRDDKIERTKDDVAAGTISALASSMAYWAPRKKKQ